MHEIGYTYFARVSKLPRCRSRIGAVRVLPAGRVPNHPYVP